MAEEYKEFYRCRNCGEYFDKKEAVKEVFCSNLCASKYTACENCGRYFIKVFKTDDDFCSDQCRQRYDELVDQFNIEEQNEGESV